MAKASTSKTTKTSAKRQPGGSKAAKASAGKAKKKVATAAKRSRKPASVSKKASKQRMSKQKTSKQRTSKQKTSKQKPSKQKTSKKTSSSPKTSKGATPRRTAGSAKRRVPAPKPGAPAMVAKTGKPASKPRAKEPAKTAAADASKIAARKKAAEAVQKSASSKGASAPPAPEAVMVSVEDAMANLPYVEGQFVVHPKYGLGRVNRILERKLSTRTVPCLEISFSYQEMKLTIPVDQVDRSGLRRPIGKKSIDDVFKVLRGRATFDAKRRSAKRVVDYRKRLGQGDPTSLAEAVRDLARLSLRKSLSYEERKILSTALRILSREVALARGREPDDVREEIEKIVYR